MFGPVDVGLSGLLPSLVGFSRQAGDFPDAGLSCPNIARLYFSCPSCEERVRGCARGGCVDSIASRILEDDP